MSNLINLDSLVTEIVTLLNGQDEATQRNLLDSALRKSLGIAYEGGYEDAVSDMGEE